MNSLDRQYQDLLFELITSGTVKSTRNGKTVSLFGRQIRHKMKDGFPLLTTKKMYWKGIVTELLWFLRGDTNIKYLIDNDCNIWTGDAYKKYSEHFIGHEDVPNQDWFIEQMKSDFKFAERWGDLGPIYGKQWRAWKGKLVDKSEELNAHTAWVPEQIDQIANLIRDLRTNPDSRRLMVSAWNVGELDQMTLPPCHYGFQVYTRELSIEERKAEYFKRGYTPNIDPLDLAPTRAISLMWNQRSVDTFLGLPFNIASYGLLLHMLAKMTNMIPDELIGNLGDAHLYQDHLSQAREQIVRQPYRLPNLYINDEFWATVDDVKDYNVSVEILSMLIEDFQIDDYESHPTIKAPLIN